MKINKNNRYSIQYKIIYDGKIKIFLFSVKKLNLSIKEFIGNTGMQRININKFNNGLLYYHVINNFEILPGVIELINSSDKTNQTLALEILKNQVNERTRINTKRSRKKMV